MMTEAESMDIVVDNEVKPSDDIELSTSDKEDSSVKGDSVKAEDEEDNNGDSPAKLINIKIPDHDIEVAVSSLPSLIGARREEDGVTVFSGQWAMNDYSHSVDGQTSDFEYRLVNKFPDSADYPPSGKYMGWFHLKHPAPKPGHVKIDDKDTTLTFTKRDDDDGYMVVGEGYNKFGRFSIHGTMSEDGKLHVYKIFKKKPVHTPKASKSLGGIKPLAPGVDVTTPRVRRPSAAILSADVEPVPEVRPRNTKHADKLADKQLAPLGATLATDNGRAQRLSIPMQKCSDVLKELSKQLQAAYFREPVDYVKLCIPDYATIVKQPMDFTTIQNNLEKFLYQSHEAFAEHVRLVFKNAITFNQRRDHPVHIAAREMSNRFEEKYRMLVSQLNNAASDFETNFRPGSLGATATGVTTGGGRGRGGGMRRQSSGGSGGRGAGPREAAVAAPALDVNLQTLVDMQRQMKEMQTELVQIKNQLRQYDIKNSVEIQRQAAHDPMTLEEKQTLVERINRLDEERMKEIIDIIREMFPAAASGDGEDVDIPIDDLDTLTLRRLQSIVSKSEKETTKRKRSQSTTPKVPGAKRSKSSNAMAATPKGSKQHQLLHQQPASAATLPLHQDSSNYNDSNPFFGATDDDMDLLGGNDDPVSMDTGMPPRPASGGTWQNVSESEEVISADYTELESEEARDNEEEEAGGGKQVAFASEVVLKNESAWTTSAVNDDHSAPGGGESNGNGAAWGEDVMQEIQEKVNNQRLEMNRKIAEEQKGREVESKIESKVEPSSVAPAAAVVVVDQEALMNQRREEERRQREDMARTINLDQHREALITGDDV
jgi:uncharacterized protein (UPF0335 family)